MTSQLSTKMLKQTDYGYSWVILVASFTAQAASIGFSIGGIGVMTLSFRKTFPDASSSDVSWIGSLRGSCQFLASPLAVPLMEKFGFQMVTIGGSLLTATGIVLSIFSKELWHVYISYGVIAGIGTACIYTTSMTILGEYFEKLKHIAFPVVALGQAVGILVFPPTLQAVVDNLGHSNALIFSACVMVLNCLCGLLFKRNNGQDLLLKCCSCCIQCPGEKASHPTTENILEPLSELVCQPIPSKSSDLTHLETAFTVSVLEQQEKILEQELMVDSLSGVTKPEGNSEKLSIGRTECCSKKFKMLHLLRTWVVWTIIWNSMLWGCCSSATEALWPLLATSHGLSDATGALGVTMSGVGFLMGSIVLMAAGKRTYDRFMLYLLSSSFCGLCVLLAPLLHLTEAVYITLFTLYGLWLGILVSLFMGVLSECVQPADFPYLIGLYNFMNGVGYFVGPITMGTLEEQFGYTVSWTVCGCLSIGASLVIVPTYVAMRRRTLQASTLAFGETQTAEAPVTC